MMFNASPTLFSHNSLGNASYDPAIVTWAGEKYDMIYSCSLDKKNPS